MPRRLITILTLTAALSGAAACGSSGDAEEASQSNAEVGQQAEQSAESVPASDLERVIRAEDSVNTTCGLTKNEAGSDMPLREAIGILQNAYRSYPEGTYARPNDTQPRNMERVVEQNAKTLRDCGRPAEASELESVLKS